MILGIWEGTVVARRTSCSSRSRLIKIGLLSPLEALRHPKSEAKAEFLETAEGPRALQAVPIWSYSLGLGRHFFLDMVRGVR